MMEHEELLGELAASGNEAIDESYVVWRTSPGGNGEPAYTLDMGTHGQPLGNIVIACHLRAAWT